jgi:hypothetical protein
MADDDDDVDFYVRYYVVRRSFRRQGGFLKTRLSLDFLDDDDDDFFRSPSSVSALLVTKTRRHRGEESVF